MEKLAISQRHASPGGGGGTNLSERAKRFRPKTDFSSPLHGIVDAVDGWRKLVGKVSGPDAVPVVCEQGVSLFSSSSLLGLFIVCARSIHKNQTHIMRSWGC
jgi:hypothetical protein